MTSASPNPLTGAEASGRASRGVQTAAVSREQKSGPRFGERIDHLLGARPPRLPLWLLVAAALTVAAAVVVVEGARASAAAHVSFVLLLMHSCWPVMLALPGLMVASMLRGWLSR